MSADILTAGQRQAVEALGLAWGHKYDIGFKGGLYFARRDDGTGEALEAHTPDALDGLIRADDQARETCHV